MERDGLVNQHQMNVEHMKSLHDGQVTQTTSQFTAQIETLKAQQDAALAQGRSQTEATTKMQETSFQSRIASLEAELDRSRRDLESANVKISDQGDLASQAQKLKTIGDSLSGVFGFGGGGLGGNAISTEPAEPVKERPKGWLGTVMDIADSRLGESLFAFLQQAAAGAGPVPGMAPPMLPGQYGGPPGYGQQPGYGPQPGYGAPPGYGPPGGGYAPPQPGWEPEEEFEEMDEEELAAEVAEEAAEAAEAAGPGPEAPPAVEGEAEEAPVGPDLASEVGPDGVVRTTTAVPEPPTLESDVGDDGVVRAVKREAAKPVEAKPKAKPRPRPTVPKPQTPPPPQKVQPQGPAPEMPPEIVEQFKMMIGGIEDSMRSKMPPQELAATISKIAPPEQLLPFAQTPIDQLVSGMVEIVPETPLASYNGKKYIAALQGALRSILEQASAAS
jgi:hypothetical protein